MRMIKSLLACLVAGTLAFSMATSAFAATATYNEGTVTVAGYTSEAVQNTVLIVKDSVWTGIESGTAINSADIYYLNQFASGETLLTDGMGTKTALAYDENDTTTYTVNGEEVSGTLYKVLLGGDNGTAITELDLFFAAPATEEPEPHYVGDVNGEGKIDVGDLTALSKYLANPTLNAFADYDCLDAADVNAEGKVDVGDLTALSKYLANPTANAFDYTYIADKPVHVPVSAE